MSVLNVCNEAIGGRTNNGPEHKESPKTLCSVVYGERCLPIDFLRGARNERTYHVEHSELVDAACAIRGPKVPLHKCAVPPLENSDSGDLLFSACYLQDFPCH